VTTAAASIPAAAAKNTTPYGTTSVRTPPSAGPIAQPRFVPIRCRPNAEIRCSSLTTSATSAYATGSKQPRSIELTSMFAASVHSGASRRICTPMIAIAALRTRSDVVISGRRPIRSDRSPAHALDRDWPRFAPSAITPYSHAG
jgi:hypothetical protein